MCGLCETRMYRNSNMSDTAWECNLGPENQPDDRHPVPPRGICMLTVRGGPKQSVVEIDKNIMLTRNVIGGEPLPLYVFETHFEESGKTRAHEIALASIERMITTHCLDGHCVLMGDFNAHTGANGDTRKDRAGRQLVEWAKKMKLTIVNHLSLTQGTFTRIVEHEHGAQTGTTIDYMMVSESLVGRVKKLVLGERLGSDHRVLLLHLAGMDNGQRERTKLREIWRTENIPASGIDQQGFVNAYQSAMRAWIDGITPKIKAMEALHTESRRIADILEWSFQARIDKVSKAQIGTKFVGPRPVPLLDRAMNALNDHRVVCECMLKRVVGDRSSTAEARSSAVRAYRDAKQALFTATKRRKILAELEKFRQIERDQANSKLFWAGVKREGKGMRASVSPPPMAQENGETVSDPVEVLKVWRRFSASIADPGLSQEEEGIFDDEHKKIVEERLARFRQLKLFQDDLDYPITDEEVFKAIRKLKMGKAPGVDGILSSVIKAAADAVGTSTLKKGNSVVEALTLLFNYVFDKEEWPERWGSGIVFPLYKQDSRLEPGNYRPITLLSVIGKLFGSVIENRLSGWSEATGAIADEQGGFRRNRGTPDQLFLLREIIDDRHKRGLPTLVTYIDARKAYDTVWREGNYVKLFDMGVQGKMWRQIQAMNKDLRSKVRLPFGETEWYDVKRGVAQGAVESPWLYSSFVNGMADELRRLGLGVMIGGVRVPLLMYADDIVMLAGSVQELHQMNKVATEYAFKNRFRHNGDKSAVMVFGATKALKQRVGQQIWTLSGELVEVKQSYKYLGVDVLTKVADWRVHFARTTRKARNRSNDLLWMCRRDKGIRPRSAMTLWKAQIRPILEYAAELWAGEVSKELITKVEKIQTDFAKAVLGLTGQRAVSGDFVRSELGLDTIAARAEKLRLGYWRRLNVAKQDRALAVVANLRRLQVLRGRGGGWMRTTERMMVRRGMAEHWFSPTLSARMEKEAWKGIVYDRVESFYEATRNTRMQAMQSVTRYIRVKHWGNMDSTRAEFKGEICKVGALVSEKYLDDVDEPLGSRLKLMCRTRCLPVLTRVAWEAKWPPSWARCLMCTSGEAEDVEHLVMRCSAYTAQRERLMATVSAAVRIGGARMPFASSSTSDKLDTLLGARCGSAEMENIVSHAFKRYMKRAWRARKQVTKALNVALDRRDIVDMRSCRSA
jgi:hypothetical protein